MNNPTEAAAILNSERLVRINKADCKAIRSEFETLNITSTILDMVKAAYLILLILYLMMYLSNYNEAAAIAIFPSEVLCNKGR